MTPGLSFLLRQLTQVILAPACITYLIFFAFTRVSVIQVPEWIHVTSCILSVPVFICTRMIWVFIREECEMRTMDAVRVPVVRGKWPGGIDLIISRRKEAKYGYPRMSLPGCFVQPIIILRVVESVESLKGRYGNIFNMIILGTSRVRCGIFGIRSRLFDDARGVPDCDLRPRTRQNHTCY